MVRIRCAVMNAMIHQLAEADLMHHVRYLRESDASEEIVRRFLDGAEEAVKRIEGNPGTWSFARGSRRVRKVQISHFRIQVFYRVREDGTPVILEFAGAGLQPRWRERL